MADNRLVQTAVVGSPDSDDPAILPTGHRDLDLFRTHHADSRFWCGVLLGGCGRELVTKRYEDRLCHFAHHADMETGPSSCSRGTHSADHLYVRRAVRAWLHGMGHDVNGELRGARYNDAVDFSLPEGLRLRFQLVPLTAGQRAQDDARARDQGELIRWFLAHPDHAKGDSLAIDNPALLVRCRTDGSTALPERRVEIGTRTVRGEPEWDRLEDCALEECGQIQTPALRARGHRQPAQSRLSTTAADASATSPSTSDRSTRKSPRPFQVNGQASPTTPTQGEHSLTRGGSLMGRAAILARQLRQERRNVPVDEYQLRILLTEALELSERMPPGRLYDPLTVAIRQAATLLRPGAH